jgi:hypothetical protein
MAPAIARSRARLPNVTVRANGISRIGRLSSWFVLERVGGVRAGRPAAVVAEVLAHLLGREGTLGDGLLGAVQGVGERVNVEVLPTPWEARITARPGADR